MWKSLTDPQVASAIGYFPTAFNPVNLAKAVDEAREFLKSSKVPEFDTIAVRGNSGAIFGGALSVALSVPLILVRKSLENSHGGSYVQGYPESSRYLIIDDFMSSGETVNAIVDNIAEYRTMALPIGAWFYEREGNNRFRTPAQIRELMYGHVIQNESPKVTKVWEKVSSNNSDHVRENLMRRTARPDILEAVKKDMFKPLEPACVPDLGASWRDFVDSVVAARSKPLDVAAQEVSK